MTSVSHVDHHLRFLFAKRATLGVAVIPTTAMTHPLREARRNQPSHDPPFCRHPLGRPPPASCGKLESECSCPPLVEAPVRLAPASQTARLRLENGRKGKVVTVVANLNPDGERPCRPGRATEDESRRGGDFKDGLIELQGDHLATTEGWLTGLGYKIQHR